MSYHLTVSIQPEGKYPFALNTEADQIPLTREELEALRFEVECALLDTDPAFEEPTDCVIHGKIGDGGDCPRC